MKTEVHPSFDPELSRAWAPLAASNGAYWSEPWLRGLANRVPSRYLLVRDDAGPAGAAVFTAFRDRAELSRIAAYYDLRVYHGLESILPEDATVPLVFFGPVSGTHNDLALRADLDEPARVRVAAAIATGAEAIADEIGARLVYYPFLRLRGVRTLRAARPEMIVSFGGSSFEYPVPDTFEQYLETLTRHTRSNVRREQKNFAALGGRMETRTVEECIDWLKPMYTAAMEAQPGLYGKPREVAETILGAAQSAAKDCRVFLAMQGDIRLGAFLTLRAGVHYSSRLAAFAAGIDRKLAAYFNVAYYEIQEAIREGVRWIECGGTAAQAKVSRGARSVPTFSGIQPWGTDKQKILACRPALQAHGRLWLKELRGELEQFGQIPDQAEIEVGPAEKAFEEIGPAP